jgi:hypothetical protein
VTKRRGRNVLFFQSFIDPELWERARWVGVGYARGGVHPPGVVLLYREGRAGQEIFESWMESAG